MIARVAEHCFWLGRYLERVESSARGLNTSGQLALDGELTPEQVWPAALRVAGQDEDFAARLGTRAAGDGEVVQNYATWDPQNPSSLARSVAAWRENARTIREVISLEVWRVTNELYVWMASHEAQAAFASHRDGFYDHIRRQTQLCLGLMRSTMLHDTPLDFIWLGVLLERTGQTGRLLDVHHHVLTHTEMPHQVVETALWLSLLRATSGFEPFVKRHQGKVTGDAVAQFLVLEPRFPRSLRYCVASAYDRLCAVRPPEASTLPGGMILTRLAALDDELASAGPSSIGSSTIHETLTHIVREVDGVCDDICRELFGRG